MFASGGQAGGGGGSGIGGGGGTNNALGDLERLYGAGDAHLMADIQQPDGIGAVNLNLDDMLRMYRVSDGPGGGGVGGAGAGGGAATMMPPRASMQMDASGGAPLPPPPVQLSAAARALIGEDAAVGLAAAGTRPVERGFALDEKMRATDVDGFLQHHHDGVVLKAVKEAIFAAEANSAEHQRRREQSQWRRERRDIVESLDVTFGTGPTRNRHNRSSSAKQQQLLGIGNGGGSAQQQQLTAASGAGGGGANNNAQFMALSGGSGKAQQQQLAAAGSSQQASSMTAPMRAYALAVRRINEAFMLVAGGPHGPPAAQAVYPVIALEECAAAAAGNAHGHGSAMMMGGTPQDVAGQKELMMCWGLLRGAVGEYPEGQSSATGAGFEASSSAPAPGKFMAYLLPEGSPDQKRCAAVLADQSRRALEAFNETFLFEDARLRRAQLASSGGGGGGGMGMVSSVASEPGLVASVAFLVREGGGGGAGGMMGGDGGGDLTPLSGMNTAAACSPSACAWAALFTCLRCGELGTSLDVADGKHDDELGYHDASGGSAGLNMPGRSMGGGGAAAEAGMQECRTAIAALMALRSAAHKQAQQTAAAAAGMGVGDGSSSSSLSQQQQESAAAWERARHAAKVVFDQLVSVAAAASAVSPFQVAVFNLLSLSEPYKHQANAAHGKGSVEDWLWQCLWFATVVPDVGSTSSGSGFTVDTLRGVIVGNQAKFEQPSNPFRYARYLFSVGEFSRAVSHLWRHGKHCDAVHLAVACHFYGILRVKHPGTAQLAGAEEYFSRGTTTAALGGLSSSTPGVGGVGGAGGGSEGGGDGSVAELPRMLCEYSKQFQHSDFHMAFEYISVLHMHSNASSSAEGQFMGGGSGSDGGDALFAGLGALMLDTDCYGVLAGYVTRGGVRIDTSSALLTKYFNGGQVQVLLQRTGQAALAKGEAQRAIDLFRLAGAWYDVLLELERQLSVHLTLSDAPDRAKWWSVAQDFHKTYLHPDSAAAAHASHYSSSSSNIEGSGGGAGTSVRDAVVRHDPGPVGRSGESLLTAFELMAKLYEFTDLARAGNFQGALQCAHGLGLLPTRNDHLEPALEQMGRLLQTHSVLSHADTGGGGGALCFLRPEHLRHLLIGAMRCHLQLHQNLRMEGGGGGGVNAAALADNAEKAAVLARFANGIGASHHSSDTLVQLDQMLMQINY